MSGIAKELTLEQQAHNDGYDKCDVRGRYPSNNTCVSGAPCCIISKLDMKKVCDSVNKSPCGVDAVVSMDPGRYVGLCDKRIVVYKPGLCPIELIVRNAIISHI